MPDINTIENLRQWFRTCPAIVRSNRFFIDFMDEKATGYSIDNTAMPIIWKTNVLGERVRAEEQTAAYIFRARLPFGSDVMQNAANMGFCADVTAWLIDQNNKGIFPEIREGFIKYINPTLTPHPVSMSESTADYEIRIEAAYKIR